MTVKRSELLTRSLSAAVLIPAVIALDWLGGVWFNLFVTVLAVLLAVEWDRLMNTGSGVPRAGFTLAAVCAFSTAYVGLSYDRTGSPPDLLLFTSLIAAGAGLVWIEQKIRRRARPILRAVGVFYICLPSAAFIAMRSGGEGEVWILWLFVVIWSTDIGAYAAGRTFGGPKLAPAISPNKTWSGAVGGVLAAVILSAPISVFLKDLDLNVAIFLALGLSVISQIGDLVESGLKRQLGVKDSGSIIPGHGGLFDRLDGLLFAAPVALCAQLFLFSTTI
ncbi:MAG: phosphatidate cytidylyltransferase [Rhodospirillales bacterium]